MIICKTPDPPDEYLHEAGSSWMIICKGRKRKGKGERGKEGGGEEGGGEEGEGKLMGLDGSLALQEVLADLKILLEIKHENYGYGIDLKYRRSDIERQDCN